MTPEQLAEIRARSAYDVRFVLPDASSQARLKDAIHDRAALLDYIEELKAALRGIEDCVAHPDSVKGEIAGTICGKCLAQVSTLTTKEPTNA